MWTGPKAACPHAHRARRRPSILTVGFHTKRRGANLSEPLPATPVTLSGLSGVEFTGVVSRTPFPTDTDSFLTSMVTLEPDTSSTAFLSFLYNLPDPSEPFAMFGRTANFKFRIDALGNFLGFRYVRTGVLSDSSDLVTLSFTSEY
jgi:hypothetical protein